MTVSRLILMMLLAGAGQSCLHRGSSPEIARFVSDTVLFASGSSPVKVIKCESILSSQQLVLNVNLTGAVDGITFQPESWELVTAEGNRSNPVKVVRHDKAGQSNGKRATLIFEPVHSRELFQRTGLRGDIEPEYRLDIKYLQNGGEEMVPVKLTASEASYSKSIRVFGMVNNTSPYALVSDDVFVKDQKAYLNRTLVHSPDREEHSIHISGNEILMNGLWLKIQAHHRRDTLYADIRMVNQSFSEIGIDLNRIVLIRDTEILNALAGDDVLNVTKGRRARIDLRFPIRRAEEYRLDLSAVTFSGKGSAIPVFSRPVTLKRTGMFPQH